MHLHQLFLFPTVIFPNPWPSIAWQPLGNTLVFEVFILPLSQLRRCAAKTVEFRSSSNILSKKSSPLLEKRPLLWPLTSHDETQNTPSTSLLALLRHFAFLSDRIRRSNSSFAVATAQPSLALRRVIAATPGLTSASRHSSSATRSVSCWLRLSKRHTEKRKAESYERAPHSALCCFLATNGQETSRQRMLSESKGMGGHR